MYKIFLEDIEHLSVMLGVNDSEYVDVFLTKEQAMFVTNSTELLAVASFPCGCSASESGVSFRIKRDVLKSLATSGGMDVTAGGDWIRMDFFTEDGKKSCSAKFEKMPVFNASYSDKLRLMGVMQEVDYVDTDEIQGLLRVGKASGRPVCIEDGNASVSVTQSLKVCKRIGCKGVFTISCSGLEALRRCNKRIFGRENYLCAYKDGLAVVVAKSRHYSDDVIRYVMENPGGSKYRADVDFYTLASFLSARRLKPDIIDVRLDRQECLVQDEGIEYCVPVPVHKAVTAEGAAFNGFKLPYSVVGKLMFPLKRTQFILEKKKNYVQLNDKDYTIYFN